MIAYNPWYKCQPELSPVSNIVKNLPPIITFAGGKDKAIPLKEMFDFHNQFKQQGNASKLYIGKAGKQGYWKKFATR